MTKEDVIRILETAPREGAAEDVPEGTRTIRLSHTLAVLMAQALRDAD